MSSRPTLARAEADACTAVLKQLKDDHKRVKKAYQEFEKIDAAKDPEACAAIVEQVLTELTVHASLEEELLYPAARGMVDEHLLDEAEVEHESMHTAIDQLRGMGPQDSKYGARFTVLCEYVLHHVKEEEGELFPQLEHARLGWEALLSRMTERRAALMDELPTNGHGRKTPTGATGSRPAAASRTAGRSGGHH